MSSEEYLKELESELDTMLHQYFRFGLSKPERRELKAKIRQKKILIRNIKNLLNGKPQNPEKNIMAAVETPERNAYKGF